MSLARSTAERLRGYADDLMSVAEAFDSQSRHHGRSDQLIARVEGIAQDIRSAVRGRASHG